MEIVFNEFLIEFEKRKDLSAPWFLCFDFDGTIKPLMKPVSDVDKKALQSKTALSCVRVIATGRSLSSFENSWEKNLDFDFLIFSSGLGICRWTKKGPSKILDTAVFTSSEASNIAQHLLSSDLGFFAHSQAKNKINCLYRFPKTNNQDFLERVKRSQKTGSLPWPSEKNSPSENFKTAWQTAPDFNHFVLIIEKEKASKYEEIILAKLKQFSILKVSSPTGRNYMWFEILPKKICKSYAADLLLKKLKIPKKNSLAFGNDYNDNDLLAWANKAYVTSDAPQELLDLYQQKPAAGLGGLAEIIENIKIF